MNPIVALGGIATFLGGVAAALLISYPIPGNSLYVCFIALFVALVAALIGAVAVGLHAIERHARDAEQNKIKADRLVGLTIDHLKRRSLELVDQD